MPPRSRSSHRPVAVRIVDNIPVAHAPVRPTPAVTKPPPITKRGARLANSSHEKLAGKSRQLAAHHWPEAQRRKFMWWLVGAGIVVMIISWASLLGWQFDNRQSKQTIFHDIIGAIKDFKWMTPKTNPAAEEIRQLDQQVFPEFQTPVNP